MARAATVVLVALLAVAGGAWAQCQQTVAGKVYDLSKANNGLYACAPPPFLYRPSATLTQCACCAAVPGT
jgi:hypothetical protein